MTVKSLTINNVTYNVAQAPATQQKKLLLLVGALIAVNVKHSKYGIVDTSVLFGALLRLPESVFDEVAGIVLYKTMIAGSDTRVDIGAFQGNISSYTMLVAEAIRYNLADFFDWVVSEKPAETPAA
jgi:hypothetical protein